MTRQDRFQEIRETLIQRRDALRQALNGDDSLLRDLCNQQGGDEIDFALDCVNGEINSQLAEVESRELSYVENALKRIEENSYGKCEACSKNIPLARLEALPYATFCIQCKIKAEEHGIEPGAIVDWSVILNTPPEDAHLNNDYRIS